MKHWGESGFAISIQNEYGLKYQGRNQI